MNIFLIHWIPTVCAMMHVDKHVIKMILETTQLLCSAHHVTDSDYQPPYKLTHKNHPCAIWTRASLSNYDWLCELGLALCDEYTYRYGKVHKCFDYIKELQKHKPPIADLGITIPAQAMPEQYRMKGNPVQAYRAYYRSEKQHIHSWKGKVAGRKTPIWI